MTDRPRVAFITNVCPHYRRPLYELLAQRLDVDFYFFSEGRERYISDTLPLEHGAFRTCPLRRVSVLGEPFTPGIASRLLSRSYDVVVKCLNGRLMVPYTYAFARARGLPFVLWTGMWHHPQTSFHRISRPLSEALYRRSDAIVVYGEHVKHHLTESAGVAADDVFVAPQSVDPALFATLEPRPAAMPEVLFVGQLEERKGIYDLLAAMRMLDERAFKLVVLGSGSLQPSVEAAARLDPRIAAMGPVSREALAQRLQCARVVVVPSITTARDREPWGLVVNEAMHAGVAVIATDAVGAAAGGLVRDGFTGHVVPERNPEALAAAIRRLLEDERYARALGAQARLHVQRFNFEAMADGFEAAIEHAMASR